MTSGVGMMTLDDKEGRIDGERQILCHFKWHFLLLVLFSFFLCIVFIFEFCIYFSFEISTVIFGEI